MSSIDKTSITRRFVRFIVCIAVLGVAAITTHGQDAQWTSVAADNGREVVAYEGSRIIVPAIRKDAKLKVIYSTLSDYKYATYFCCVGMGVSGPNSQFRTHWYGIPFTPSTNVKLTKVEAAIRWESGSNSFAISLAADSGGLPGGTLAGPVDVYNVPSGGGCCELAVAKFKSVPLEKGTQYWVIVGTDSNSENAAGAWFLNTTDMRRLPFAMYSGNWQSIQGVLPAVGVFGK